VSKKKHVTISSRFTLAGKHITLPRQIGASMNDCTERTVVKGSSCISESQSSLHFVAS